jgi:hypothetical protein
MARAKPPGRANPAERLVVARTPRLVGDAGRSLTTSARPYVGCCFGQRGFGIWRMPVRTLTEPGPLPGQRVWGNSVPTPLVASTWSSRERACSPVARPHTVVASGAALPRPGVPGRTCLAWTPGYPPTRPRRTGSRVTGVTPPHRTQAEGSDVVPTGFDRTSHARPAKCRTRRSAWSGHRDIGVVARTFDFLDFSQAAHILSPDPPIQLRHAGDAHDRGFLPRDPAQSHDPGASIPQTGCRPGTTTNAQAMATSHNLRSHEIAPRLRPHLNSVLTGPWSPSSTISPIGTTS